MLCRSDEWLISVVVTEIDVGLLLDDRVEPPVIDAECDKGDILACDRAGLDCCILRLKIRGKFCNI